MTTEDSEQTPSELLGELRAYWEDFGHYGPYSRCCAEHNLEEIAELETALADIETRIAEFDRRVEKAIELAETAQNGPRESCHMCGGPLVDLDGRPAWAGSTETSFVICMACLVTGAGRTRKYGEHRD